MQCWRGRAGLQVDPASSTLASMALGKVNKVREADFFLKYMGRCEEDTNFQCDRPEEAGRAGVLCPQWPPSPRHGHGEAAGSRNSARLLGGREGPWLQKLGLNAVKQSIMYNLYLKLMRLACLQNAF